MPVPVTFSEAVLPTHTATISEASLARLVSIHRDGKYVRVFATIDGVFALFGCLSTGFAGYMFNCFMCAVGYVGARDVLYSCVTIYGIYAALVAVASFAYGLAYALGQPSEQIAAVVLDGLVNVWIAHVSRRMSENIRALKETGVTVSASLVEAAAI